MKNNIIIDKELSIRPVDGFDYFTQHSVGTKYVAAKLDGWAPAADEHLFIAFEKADGSYKIDPIILGRTVDRVYFTVVPEEVIHDDGEWTMCIYKKLHWNETTGKADLCEVGKKFTFTVMSTIRDDSGNVITQYDLVNLAQFQKDLENGHYAARGLYSWNKDYLYGVGEIIFYPDHGEYGTFLKSTIVDNDNAPYVNGALNSAYWEEVIDFDILNGLYDVRDEVAQSAADAAASAGEAAQTVADGKTDIAGIIAAGQAGIDETAERAEQSATAAAGSAQSAAGSVEQAKGYADAASAKATEAQSWADVAKYYAQFGIQINTDYTSVADLPVPGNAQFMYFIPNGGADENSYDEYVWVESKNSYEKIGTTEIDLTSYATKAEVAAETAARESADNALGERIDGAETEITALKAGEGNVTGVKGNAETAYRTGNVNLTPENIGAMGIYGQTGNVSLNTIIKNGTYYVSQNATDTPNDLKYGELIVARNEDTVAQIYIHYQSKEIWVRSGTPVEAGGGGQWVDWYRLANAADVVDKAGDTMTGDLTVEKPQSGAHFIAKTTKNGEGIQIGVNGDDASTGIWDLKREKWLMQNIDGTVYIDGKVPLPLSGGTMTGDLTAPGLYEKNNYGTYRVYSPAHNPVPVMSVSLSATTSKDVWQHKTSFTLHRGDSPALLTVYGLETSSPGGILLSYDSAISTAWNRDSTDNDIARTEGEQAYWGKQYLCCTAVVIPQEGMRSTINIWVMNLTNIRYTLQPLLSN